MPRTPNPKPKTPNPNPSETDVPICLKPISLDLTQCRPAGLLPGVRVQGTGCRVQDLEVLGRTDHRDVRLNGGLECTPTLTPPSIPQTPSTKHQTPNASGAVREDDPGPAGLLPG